MIPTTEEIEEAIEKLLGRATTDILVISEEELAEILEDLEYTPDNVTRIY